mmetsp:Transcript_126398/g.365915  ORF Transcript_126398/g.365915 Transcript_126398/m.365915 type:complete len:224 (+) Transcript_126398:1513-2184(+)
MRMRWASSSTTPTPRRRRACSSSRPTHTRSPRRPSQSKDSSSAQARRWRRSFWMASPSARSASPGRRRDLRTARTTARQTVRTFRLRKRACWRISPSKSRRRRTTSTTPRTRRPWRSASRSSADASWRGCPRARKSSASSAACLALPWRSASRPRAADAAFQERASPLVARRCGASGRMAASSSGGDGTAASWISLSKACRSSSFPRAHQERASRTKRSPLSA